MHPPVTDIGLESGDVITVLDRRQGKGYDFSAEARRESGFLLAGDCETIHEVVVLSTSPTSKTPWGT